MIVQKYLYLLGLISFIRQNKYTLDTLPLSYSFCYNSELCGTFAKKLLLMPIFQFSVKFSLFKVDSCFGKGQNAIIPLQIPLESNFFVRFENASLTRSLQAIL
jgi:hypothetical protein